jgi:hypothetical protein
MHRRNWLKNSIFGLVSFFGFSKIAKAEEENPDNLPVVEFDDDGLISINFIKQLLQKNTEKSKIKVWVRRKDQINYPGMRIWGECILFTNCLENFYFLIERTDQSKKSKATSPYRYVLKTEL